MKIPTIKLVTYHQVFMPALIKLINPPDQFVILIYHAAPKISQCADFQTQNGTPEFIMTLLSRPAQGHIARHNATNTYSKFDILSLRLNLRVTRRAKKQFMKI